MAYPVSATRNSMARQYESLVEQDRPDIPFYQRGWSRERSREFVLILSRSLKVVGSQPESFLEAVDLATEHQLQYLGALMLNIAADAVGGLPLSEDLPEGFAWRGVTVVNPFAKRLDKRLSRVLGE